MKTQTLYKRLSLPLLLTVISATGIGVTPARSASLMSFQNTAIKANPEATLIAQRCPYGMKPEYPPPCHSSSTNVAPPNSVDEQSPSENPSKDPRSQRYRQQQQRKLEQQRQQQQRELEQQRQQQQRELEQQRQQQQRELEQQPNAEP